MPLMISRIGHTRGRPVLFAAGRWGSITRHSLSVTSVWYRFVSRICCIRVVGVHMVSPGLVSATPWNHADPSHSTSFETASKVPSPQLGNSGDRLVLGPVLFLHHFGTTGSSERFVPDLILHWDRTSTNDGLDGLIPLSNIDSSLCPC